MEFVHIGVPTTEIKENEIYLAPLKVFVTVADDHEYKFEYLRYESGTPLPIEMQHQPHIAIKVASIEEEKKKMDRVIFDTFDAGDINIAFAIKEGVIFELIEEKNK
ncbi:hypothetical protein LIY46_09895 [Fusobacterium varium]|uniref:hypothetical protein n=1 Tax=Fusobacterium TaxID=848 RepID=UPI00102F5A7B|nr:hypothetical protein [Fusobacterium ulcerans]